MSRRFGVLGATFCVLVLGSGFLVRPHAAASQATAPDYEALKKELLEMRESDQKFRDAAPLSITQVRSGPDTAGKLVLHPIEDERNVDARRASVGLPPLALYLKEFGIDYTPPK